MKRRVKKRNDYEKKNEWRMNQKNVKCKEERWCFEWESKKKENNRERKEVKQIV